jgi:hypothetical protein
MIAAHNADTLPQVANGRWEAMAAMVGGAKTLAASRSCRYPSNALGAMAPCPEYDLPGQCLAR